jgi:predicted lipoprotein with Yx(FWY)xxD motif
MSVLHLLRGRRTRAVRVLAAWLALLLASACTQAGDGSPTANVPTPTPAMSETATMSEEASESPSEEATESEAASGDATVQVAESDLGEILVDAEGMTLYIFTNDTQGTSNCSGDCLANWPPLTVDEGEEPTGGDDVTAELGTITRDDGSLQVTVNGLPLYYFAADQAAGDVNGQNVGGVWFVVGPDGEMIEGTAAAPDNPYDY